MYHRYARQALPEQARERWSRRITAWVLASLVILALLWLVARPTPKESGVAQQDRPLLVTLLPLVETEPVNPPPVQQPPPVRARIDSESGGQRLRQAPVAHHKPALAPFAPRHSELADTMPLAVAAASATANPVLSSLVGLDPDAGGQTLAIGNSDGAGTGKGKGVGSGSGSSGIEVLGAANWVWKPTDEALSPFSPPIAVARHESGRAVIACRVKLSTHVHDCKIVAESINGLGFGTAAVAASRIFRIHPPRRNGKPLDDAWVAIPILWISKAPVKKAASVPQN